MYAVIDKRSIPPVATREQADAYLEQLQQYNKEADWHLFIAVNPDVKLENFERLYALAGFLLSASRLDPQALTLAVVLPDGATQEVSALTVMNGAREYLDQVSRAN